MTIEDKLSLLTVVRNKNYKVISNTNGGTHFLKDQVIQVVYENLFNPTWCKHVEKLKITTNVKQPHGTIVTVAEEFSTVNELNSYLDNMELEVDTTWAESTINALKQEIHNIAQMYELEID
jgi:hypothetical protein